MTVKQSVSLRVIIVPTNYHSVSEWEAELLMITPISLRGVCLCGVCMCVCVVCVFHGLLQV